MTRPAELTAQAQADLRSAVRAMDSTLARRRLRNVVLEAANLIGSNPALGSRRPKLAGPRYRFWSIPRFRYVLVYTDATDPPRILRVLHTSRDLAPLLAALRDPGMPGG